MIKKLFGKLAYYTGGPILFPLFLRNTKRSRTLMVSGNRVLLLKGIISSQRWTLPGGGIGKKEDPTEGAVREIIEETSIVVDPKQLTYLGSATNKSLNSTYQAEYFFVDLKDSKSPKLRAWEHLDIGWFEIESLPQPIHNDVLTALEFYNSKIQSK